jgi:transcriptional regulator of heat shock response
LFYDSDLRRTFDEIEDTACHQLRMQSFSSFEDIEELVYRVSRVVKELVELKGVVLTNNVPQGFIEELRDVA